MTNAELVIARAARALGCSDCEGTDANLWAAIDTWSGDDPAVARRLARAIAASYGGAPFAYRLPSARTIGDAWRQICEAIGPCFYADGYDLVTDRNADGTWHLGFRVIEPREASDHRTEECLVLVLRDLLCAVAPWLDPIRATFQHARRSARTWGNAVGIKVAFRAANYGLVLSGRSFRAPVIRDKVQLEALRERSSTDTTTALLADKVRDLIHQMIVRGRPHDVIAIAKQLGHSKRTLQRRLSAESTTIRGERDNVRLAMAKELLAHDNITVRQVAVQLGFVDTSHFNRSVRLWTGDTAMKLRTRRGAP